MQMIIDGDLRMPTEIAEFLGFTGGVVAGEELKEQVKKVVEANPEIVKKIIDTKKTGPVMSLVG